MVVEIKPHHGHVDLRFKNVVLGDLRRAFSGGLPTGADTVAASSNKSCAIRLAYPPADVRQPFDTQKELVRPMMAGADTLFKFAGSEAAAIARLLGYSEI